MSDYKLSSYKRPSASLISNEPTWERPFTVKRYIHPPLCERMYTMWPSMIVMMGDIVESRDVMYHSSAFRILTGENADPIKFDEIKYYTRDDGIPIHRISAELRDSTLTMESFCNVTRKASSFTRLMVKNKSDKECKEIISIMPRTGLEKLLVGVEVDGYAHFNQNIANWGFMQLDWKYENGIITDGKHIINAKYGDSVFLWQGDVPGRLWQQRHLMRIEISLAPQEEKHIDICFDRGEFADFDYDAEREKTLGFWQGELTKIKLNIDKSDELKSIQNNFTCQMLQMFCYPMGKDYILPRQGGLQRAIWPVEAMEFLMALDKTGDYYYYTEKAYDTMLDVLQVKEGDDCGCVLNLNGQMWASNTAGAVLGLCTHLMCRKDRTVFDKFRPALVRAYNWMQNKRRESDNYENAQNGVFPPMRASDWPDAYQSWCYTDGNNILGYKAMAEAFELFDDEMASEICNSYNEYMKVMENILDNLAKDNVINDEFNVPNRLGYPAVDPQIGPIGDSSVNLLRGEIIKPGSEYARLCENYYMNRGYGKNGLMGLMGDGLLIQGHNADYWAGHTWYTNMPDMCWFYSWLKSGEREKAKNTLDAQLKYSMTSEYYMCERYADNDPYFVPWLPNASAMGRTIMMIMDYYGIDM